MGNREAKAAGKAAKAVVRIAENREAKAQDYEVALSQVRAPSIELQKELIEYRFRLKSELTREQWAALHAAPASADAAR